MLSLKRDGEKWDKEQDLPIPVRFPEVASVETSTFLLDTWDSRLLLHLDTKTNMWSKRAKMPLNLDSSGSLGVRMVAVKDHLLVGGGRFQKFLLYNLATDTWTTGNPPRLGHYHGALGYRDQRLYLIGGLDETGVEEYDMDNDSWSVCDWEVPYEKSTLHALMIDP